MKQVEGIHVARREPPDPEPRVGDVWYVKLYDSSKDITEIEITFESWQTVRFFDKSISFPTVIPIMHWKISDIEWIERVSEGCDD